MSRLERLNSITFTPLPEKLFNSWLASSQQEYFKVSQFRQAFDKHSRTLSDEAKKILLPKVLTR